MTDNEIVKAMICCTNFPVCDRDNCPYGESTNCATMLGKDVVELINRQKAEIERLYSIINKIGTGIANVEKILPDMRKEIKAEAIKEFAERLKANSSSFQMYGEPAHYIVTIDGIDYLVKEMVGEEE